MYIQIILYTCVSHAYSVYIATGYRLDGRNSIPGKGKRFSWTSSRPALQPNQPSTQGIPRDFSSEIKRPEHESGRSLKSNAEVKSHSLIGIHGELINFLIKYKENFVFYIRVCIYISKMNSSLVVLGSTTPLFPIDLNFVGKITEDELPKAVYSSIITVFNKHSACSAQFSVQFLPVLMQQNHFGHFVKVRLE